ncbi:MAG TPA: imidazole glycerol phosphate synthase subunit HisH [Terriglobales bacterium]|nr:imidazole glycerol phosphate synthase subunit HisH [Terriglobales bacterium]
MRVSIFNYGVGNLYSLQTALRREGAKPQITSDIRKVKVADALLLPGVGSFSEAANRLPYDEIHDLVKTGKPILGVCLGLQLFFKSSDEGPGRGLALLSGKVRRLPSTVKVPQIGWNVLKVRNRSELVEGVPNESWVYYVHSYYPDTQDDCVVATTEYGLEYPCLVAKNNIFGTQFHPEKSGTSGRIILQNFLRLVRR